MGMIRWRCDSRYHNSSDGCSNRECFAYPYLTWAKVGWGLYTYGSALVMFRIIVAREHAAAQKKSRKASR